MKIICRDMRDIDLGSFVQSFFRKIDNVVRSFGLSTGSPPWMGCDGVEIDGCAKRALASLTVNVRGSSSPSVAT
jgi:hypothetical protein